MIKMRSGGAISMNKMRSDGAVSMYANMRKFAL